MALGDTGVDNSAISSHDAMGFPAVYAAVRNLAESVAMLPLVLYKQDEKHEKRERAYDHPLYDLLSKSPNPNLTAFEFREWMQAQMVLHGSAFAEIQWDSRGQVVALWPLISSQMTIRVVGESFIYEYNAEDGKRFRLLPERVLHLRGFSTGGLLGLSPLGACPLSVRLGITLQRFAYKFFKNGAHAGTVLETDNTMTDDEVNRLRESIQATVGGIDQAHRLLVLEYGLKWKSMGIDPAAAQSLESRTFAIGDVARIFNMPPHRLMELSRATFSNIEHQGMEYLRYTLDPHLVRWEQRICKDLLKPKEQKLYFAEFLRDSLLRSDTKSRYEAYAVAVNNGFMTRNEVRRKENMDPLEGLDMPLFPLNMGKAGEKPVENMPNPDTNKTEPEENEPNNDPNGGNNV